MQLTDLLQQDWELCLNDWGMDLTLEIVTENLNPESGTFSREIELVAVKGISISEELKPQQESQVGYPEVERQFLLDKSQLPAEQSLLVCNLLLDQERFEIINFEVSAHFVKVSCKKTGSVA